MAERSQIKSKKVLIVLPYLKNGDGTAVAVMNYYDSLIADGWHVDFLHLKTQECEWLNKVQQNSGNVFELPEVNKYSPSVSKYIKNIICSNHYDVVHVNLPGHIGYTVLKYARKANIAVRLFHAHNPKNSLSYKTVVSTFIYDHLIQKEATAFAACSESAGRSRFLKKNFMVLKNVIDIDRFQYKPTVRAEIRNDLNIDDKVVVGVVARFSGQKNPDFIIQCFEEFHKIEPRAFLLWVGDGELRESVEEKLNRMHLESNYRFVGRKSDIENWYSAMDLFFLPSVFEGMGIVFLEAQCTGLPCLGSSNVPVETELTELMYRMDLSLPVSQWALKMKEIIDNAPHRKSRTDAFATSGYTHEATKDDLRDYYNDLIN